MEKVFKKINSDHAIGLLLSITRKININIKYDQKYKFDKKPILNEKTAVIIEMSDPNGN